MSATPKVGKASVDAAKKADNEPSNYLRGPEHSRMTLDVLCGPAYRRPVIIERYLTEDVCAFNGAGNAGKTTELLYESVHVILGRPLFDGRKILRSGAVLLISKEDDREVTEGRINDICRGLNLSKKDYKKVRDNFYIEDVAGTSAKIVEMGRDGLHQTRIVDEIIAKYKAKGIVMTLLDPTSNLGPGELSGNDGGSEFVGACIKLRKELQCAVRFLHHVSKEVARNQINDAYSGRGGGSYTDNARGTHQFTIHRKREIEFEECKYTIPNEVSNEDLTRGNVIVIYVHRLSYIKRDPTPIVLVRKDFAYTYVPVELKDSSPIAKERRQTEEMERVQHYVEAEHAENVRIHKRDLEDEEHRIKVGLSRDDVRERVNALLELGLLIEVPLPAHERRGKRTKYLAPGGVKTGNPADAAQSGGTGVADSTTQTDPAARHNGGGRYVYTAAGMKRSKKGLPPEPKKTPARSIRRHPAAKSQLNGQAVDHG